MEFILAAFGAALNPVTVVCMALAASSRRWWVLLIGVDVTLMIQSQLSAGAFDFLNWPLVLNSPWFEPSLLIQRAAGCTVDGIIFLLLFQAFRRRSKARDVFWF